LLQQISERDVFGESGVAKSSPRMNNPSLGVPFIPSVWKEAVSVADIQASSAAQNPKVLLSHPFILVLLIVQ
jgi:hypothetical protein